MQSTCQGPLFGRGILSFTNWNKQKHTMSNLLQSERVHIKGQMYLTSKYQWNCFCSLTPVLHTHTNTHTNTNTHTHTITEILFFKIWHHLTLGIKQWVVQNGWQTLTKLQLVQFLWVAALSSFSHKGLQKSWKQTSIYLLVIPHKSHQTATLHNPQK